VTALPGRGLEMHSTRRPLVEIFTSVHVESPGEMRIA
jgi:hypothetical protein